MRFLVVCVRVLSKPVQLVYSLVDGSIAFSSYAHEKYCVYVLVCVVVVAV